MALGLAGLSLIGVLVALLVPGWSDLLMLAGPCLLASLWLVWRDYGPIGRRAHRFDDLRRGADQGPARKKRDHVIIDGSNVMHWQQGVPSLEPVVLTVRALEARGLRVGVMFDANAGYKTDDRYQDDREMARRLGLPEDRVLVVPKGTVADEYILKAARSLKARVVTNDRYRDWHDTFPEAAEPGFLIRGGVKDGAVWLDPRDLAAGPPLPGKSAAVRP